MALQANTIKLRQAAGERLGSDTFDSYLAELEVVEASTERVVLRVGATLAREAARRCSPALAEICRELFGSRRVLLAGDGEWFELGERSSHGETPRPGKPAKPGRAIRGRRRVRQRSGPCGQQGATERLEAQRSFRVPFQIAASLPRTASQAFARHSNEQPLEYVGRWGRARSEESLTPFHHRLLLGALRLAQAGCLTDQGVACSINLLLLAADGKGSRELPVARDQTLPALAGLLHAHATHTAHHVAAHTGEPYIAEQRKLDQPILADMLVRTADDPDRLRSWSEIMVHGQDGRFQQTVGLARGGGASVLIVFTDWVLDTLDAPADQAGTTFVVLDTAPFLQVGSRRLLSWLAVRTAPAVDAKTQLPAQVPSAEQHRLQADRSQPHQRPRLRPPRPGPRPGLRRHSRGPARRARDRADRPAHPLHARDLDRPHPAAMGVLAHHPRTAAPRRSATPPRRPAAMAQPPADNAGDRPPAAPREHSARLRGLADVDEAL
jgi:hypothetical protein